MATRTREVPTEPAAHTGEGPPTEAAIRPQGCPLPRVASTGRHRRQDYLLDLLERFWANLAQRAFWEGRREPLFPLPGGGMGYWPLRTPLPGRRDTQEAGSVERTKGEAPTSEGSGRAEMERRLIEKSVEDDAFRRRLIEDPKGPWKRSWGRGCPRGRG